MTPDDKFRVGPEALSFMGVSTPQIEEALKIVADFHATKAGIEAAFDTTVNVARDRARREYAALMDATKKQIEELK